MKRLVGALEAFERFMVRVESASAGFLLLGMASLAFFEVVGRNVFKSSLAWSDILLRQGVLWITMIGASLAASDRRHIKLDILLRAVPERWAPRVRRATAAAACVVCAVLAKASWVYVAAEREFATELWSGMKAWPFEVVLPWGFAMLGLKFLIHLLGGGLPEGEMEAGG